MRSVTTLDLHDADRAMAAMRAECELRGDAAVLVVADAHGDPISLIAMDGTYAASITIAMNKAYTAARERRSTADLGRGARDPDTGFDVAYYGDPRIVGWGGGVPVFDNGACVGAIAVSGLPEADDLDIAAIGLAALHGSHSHSPGPTGIAG